MKCLVDADVLLYEVGFAAESSWKYQGKEGIPPFDIAEEQLLNLIARIENECNADEPSLFFFTGKTNFRNDIAKTTPYKARLGPKPFHYHNIRAYIKALYDFEERESFEADDLMAIYQTARINERQTIICSRDKDLKQVDGLHYGWECYNQPSFGPEYVQGYGRISLQEKPKKIVGVGSKFFLSQCLTGDSVDSVPGIPGCGPVTAYKTLADTQTYEEGLEAVVEAYKGLGMDYLLEQGQLLWMTREVNEEGGPVLWKI